MVATRVPRKFTFDEYVELERSSDGRNELVNGGIYAMTGGTREHSLISGNVFAALKGALRGRKCEAHGADLHMFLPDAGIGTYADTVVFCGPMETYKARKDVFTNPTLVVEVLSPSTEMYDRFEKFAAYRTAPSFAEYLLVSQDRAQVEISTRQADGAWLQRVIRGLKESVELSSISVRLPLAEIYERVELA